MSVHAVPDETSYSGDGTGNQDLWAKPQKPNFQRRQMFPSAYPKSQDEMDEAAIALLLDPECGGPDAVRVELQEARAEIRRLLADYKDFEDKIQRLRMENDGLEIQLQDVQDKMAKLKKDDRLQKLRSENDECKVQLQDVENEMAKVRLSLHMCTAEAHAYIKKLQADRRKLQAQGKQKDDEIEILRSQNCDFNIELQKMKDQLTKVYSPFPETSHILANDGKSQEDQRNIRVQEEKDNEIQILRLKIKGEKLKAERENLLAQGKEEDDQLEILRSENKECHIQIQDSLTKSKRMLKWVNSPAPSPGATKLSCKTTLNTVKISHEHSPAVHTVNQEDAEAGQLSIIPHAAPSPGANKLSRKTTPNLVKRHKHSLAVHTSPEFRIIAARIRTCEYGIDSIMDAARRRDISHIHRTSKFCPPAVIVLRCSKKNQGFVNIGKKEDWKTAASSTTHYILRWNADTAEERRCVRESKMMALDNYDLYFWFRTSSGCRDHGFRVGLWSHAVMANSKYVTISYYYYRPSETNFPTFDSFYMDEMGHGFTFQASEGDKKPHTVKSRGREWLEERGITKFTHVLVSGPKNGNPPSSVPGVQV
ncbi:hypothetical protein B0H13DRAFT_1862840 [Mycena leptocephala]|nr:hypothetical protein B0H13DRAFT_1862840 [Mycena leptocephala]